MVTVVIYEGDLSPRYGKIALHIKSPSNTRKILIPLIMPYPDTFIGSNSHGCCRVERIMATRHGKPDFEAACVRDVSPETQSGRLSAEIR